MSIAKYKPFLYTVAVVVTIVAFVSESVVFLKETNEQFTINIIPIKDSYLGVITLILMVLSYFHSCFTLISGIMEKDFEKTVPWLTSTAVFFGFMMFNWVTSNVVLNTFTIIVVFLTWISIFIIGIDYHNKNDDEDFLIDNEKKVHNEAFPEKKPKVCVVEYI